MLFPEDQDRLGRHCLSVWLFSVQVHEVTPVRHYLFRLLKAEQVR